MKFTKFVKTTKSEKPLEELGGVEFKMYKLDSSTGNVDSNLLGSATSLGAHGQVVFSELKCAPVPETKTECKPVKIMPGYYLIRESEREESQYFKNAQITLVSVGLDGAIKYAVLDNKNWVDKNGNFALDFALADADSFSNFINATQFTSATTQLYDGAYISGLPNVVNEPIKYLLRVRDINNLGAPIPGTGRADYSASYSLRDCGTSSDVAKCDLALIM
ncbi:MAG: hypothetical protein LBP35_05445 [Candidatus Ancillula trichonymphae]|nr:hypothetical protein [Candidatus Ancillula trichonymphae]